MLNTVLCTSRPNDKVAFELWAKALPKMNDIRDRIDNKVCFVDGHAYVAGGESHKKA